MDTNCHLGGSGLDDGVYGPDLAQSTQNEDSLAALSWASLSFLFTNETYVICQKAFYRRFRGLGLGP